MYSFSVLALAEKFDFVIHPLLPSFHGFFLFLVEYYSRV